MCQTAATVCDRVLPDVPLRQWVLSVSYELRRVLAADPAMLTRTSRVFFEELRRWYREASGIARGNELKVEAGAITFVHRGGGSLNSHVHLHVIAADGVWRCATDGSTPIFGATRPPTKGDLERLLARVAVAVAVTTRGPRRSKGVGGRPARAASTAREAGEAAGEAVDEARFGRRPPKAQGSALEGFKLHASVVIGAMDRRQALLHPPRSWVLVMMVLRMLPRFVMRKIGF
jgi:hypothetical protein